LGVGQVSDDLAIGANCLGGLEVVILLWHLFGGAEQNALLKSVDVLGECAEGIDGGLLFLRNGGHSKKTQQNYRKRFSHGRFLLFDWYARVAET
jgi:hypothetical protein